MWMIIESLLHVRRSKGVEAGVGAGEKPVREVVEVFGIESKQLMSNRMERRANGGMVREVCDGPGWGTDLHSTQSG